MNSRRMAAQAKGLAARVVRSSAAALTALMMSSLPARAIPQCIAYNVISGGGSERGDINTFEELCGAASQPTARQQCGCLIRAITAGFSTPLNRQIFRMEVLVEPYPSMRSRLSDLEGCMTSADKSSYVSEKAKFMASPSFKNCTTSQK